MNCRDFNSSLLAYLRGEVPEPGFGEMVEHEANCPVCRRRVADVSGAGRSTGTPGAGQPTSDGDSPGSNPPSNIRPGLGRESSGPGQDRERNEEFLVSVIDRTSGADCDWVSLRMAEAMDEPLSPKSERPVREHLADCRSCQRLREQLNALPDYYAALPVLRPDRQFTADVLARTVGPRPGFIDVIRAIWSSPGSLWESAAACALVAVAVFGSAVPSFDTVSESVRDVAQSAQVATVRWGSQHSSENSPSLIRKWSTDASSVWDGTKSRAIRISEWTEQTSTDVRTKNFPGLLEDIRVVLEPLGLYPEDEDLNDPEAHDPEIEAESGVEADADGTIH